MDVEDERELLLPVNVKQVIGPADVFQDSLVFPDAAGASDDQNDDDNP
jgi:hypothetical protein